MWRKIRNNNSVFLAYAVFKSGGADLDDPRVAIAYDEEAEASTEYFVDVVLTDILNAMALGIIVSDVRKDISVQESEAIICGADCLPPSCLVQAY